MQPFNFFQEKTKKNTYKKESYTKIEQKNE